MPISPRFQGVSATPSLGPGFFDAVPPATFPRAVLRFRNRPWADRVGLGELTDEEWIAHFARFEPLPGSLPEPLSLRYHGHQFQQYNPALGDGRGFLFAQLRDPEDGRLLDLGTKGSGRTPWSRSGDGRLTLKGGVREVLATEMLEALGVSTSKTFSLIETGEALVRGDEPSPTRSSVLVRLSHGHVRIGSFQRLAYLRETDNLRKLLSFAIERYYPELAAVPAEEQAPRFLREVARRNAETTAAWMVAGFVHGVLNTDNINITGESFDYGPYRFLPRYDPRFVAAYFDEGGLYAFGRQPAVMRWNLDRLADALAPLSSEGRLRAELVDFEVRALGEFHARLLARLGLGSIDPLGDAELATRVVCFLAESGVGYDRFFFDWYGGEISAKRAMGGAAAGFYRGEKWEALRAAMAGREAVAPERLGEAYFAGEGPCGLLIDEIEGIWKGIAERDDWSLFEAKIGAIRAMGVAVGRRR